ncbi:MAG: hypothetical protein Q9M19_07370 [Mariprofundaceae bacterium]|nr:hypothetical protein [Mariprofundaceae bacterium]
MFKWLFWLVLIGSSVFVGAQVLPIYNNNMKIDNVFEGVARNLASGSAADARSRVLGLLAIQGVDREALPDTFIENLFVEKNNGKLQIGSEYHITLWLLGEPVSVDPDEEYKASDVEPMDKLRLRARMDFDFAPYQETP